MMALRSFQHPGHGAMTLLLVMSRWEWLFALLASSLALASTTAGCTGMDAGSPVVGVHRRRPAAVSPLYLPLKESLLWHGVATAMGGALLACAHIANRRALHRQ